MLSVVNCFCKVRVVSATNERESGSYDCISKRRFSRFCFSHKRLFALQRLWESLLADGVWELKLKKKGILYTYCGKFVN